MSCNTYDKGGQKEFEEFVSCVTQHKVLQQSLIYKSIELILVGTLGLF